MSPLTPDSIYDLIELSDVRVSPDGSQVVFVRSNTDRASNANQRTLWHLALAQGARAEPLSASTKDSMPRWSPDGQRLAFLSGRDDKPKVFVLPLRGEARQIAAHPNGISSFVWSPDGKRVAYIASMRADERAKEDAAREHNASDGESPDLRSAFEKRQERERRDQAEQERLDPREIDRVPYRSGTTFMEGRWQQVFVSDVPASFAEVSTTRPVRVTGFEANHALPSWAQDGSALFSTLTREPDNSRLYAYHDIVKLSSNGLVDAERLTSAGYSYAGPQVSPDGRWIAVLRVQEDKLLHRNGTLAVMPIDGGTPVDLTADLDREVMAFVWARDSASLYFTLEKDGAVNLWRISVPAAVPLEVELRNANVPTNIRGRLIDDLGLSARLAQALRRVNVRTVGELLEFQASGKTLPEDTQIQLTQLTDGEMDITSFDVAADGRVVFTACTPEDPAVLMLREANGTLRTLYAPNAALLDDAPLARIEMLRYGSDEHAIQGWVVKPADFDVAKKYPLAVNIHGGPHLQWTPSYPSMFLEFQALAQRGYVVFFCNPRGSRGYGEKFMAANWRDWGEGPMRDVMRGVDILIERGYIDENRLAITGGSYGGYLTAWMIAHSDRFRAAVAQRGVYNLLSVRNTSDIPQFFDFEFGATPADDAMYLWENSPVAHASAINTPLLIEHSENDFRVPIEQGEQLFQALSTLKKTVAFVRWPREGHELSRAGEPKHRIERLERMIAWFDRYCQ
jgi:dipeptidyl aminopeptidase/acylaminoacyl peptidase